MEEDATAESETVFEESAKEARRAQWSLNLLVVLSAVAGAVFFGYVLFHIKPFGGKQPDAINVPTSAVGDKFGVLVGSDDGSGVSVALRDIDEAPTYREKLSEVMRKNLGISVAGRLYLLIVRNDGDSPVSLNIRSLNVKDGGGQEWSAKWLDEIAEPADANGRMRLAQSGRKFELEKGDERQLYLFIPSGGDTLPPSGEDFLDGEVRLSDQLEVTLRHTEIKATAP